MKLVISRTASFRKLQRNIGSATYRLNTIVVGLTYVADGGDIKGNLPVTWTKPPTKDKAKQVSDQARIFACTSALALAFDTFDQYLRDIAKEEWLGFGHEAIEIATKENTRPSSKGGDYSFAERAEALLSDLAIDNTVLVAGIELFSKWRNFVIHSSDREPNLDNKFEKILVNQKSHFYDHYSHLNIQLALDNFYAKKSPVLKEATSLLAIVQNLSRTIDEAAIRRKASCEDDMIVAVKTLLSAYFNNSRRKSTAWGEITAAWQGSEERKLEQLKKMTEKIGITETKKGVSATLPNAYIENLITLDRYGFATEFGIKAP